MSRPSVPTEVKKREGKMLENFFLSAKLKEESLTQEGIIDEMGFKSQGLFSQWVTGKTRISDPNLVWLGKRLRFNPLEVRPELERYISRAQSPQEQQLLGRYRMDHSFRAAVDAIAEMSPFYLDHSREVDDQSHAAEDQTKNGMRK